MLPGNASQLDLLAFIETQRRERYRAFIIHAPPLKGKTAFARHLAAATGGAYVDVLAHVAASPELSTATDTLDVPFLKRLALEAARSPGQWGGRAAGGGRPGRLVILDDFDFLVPVWGDDLSSFLETARKLSVTETESVIAFVMQTRRELDETDMPSSAGRSRVLRLDEIQAL